MCLHWVLTNMCIKDSFRLLSVPSCLGPELLPDGRSHLFAIPLANTAKYKRPNKTGPKLFLPVGLVPLRPLGYSCRIVCVCVCVCSPPEDSHTVGAFHTLHIYLCIRTHTSASVFKLKLLSSSSMIVKSHL